jgi:hypothetical protein
VASSRTGSLGDMQHMLHIAAHGKPAAVSGDSFAAAGLAPDCPIAGMGSCVVAAVTQSTVGAMLQAYGGLETACSSESSRQRSSGARGSSRDHLTLCGSRTDAWDPPAARAPHLLSSRLLQGKTSGSWSRTAT